MAVDIGGGEIGGGVSSSWEIFSVAWPLLPVDDSRRESKAAAFARLVRDAGDVGSLILMYRYYYIIKYIKIQRVFKVRCPEGLRKVY